MVLLLSFEKNPDSQPLLSYGTSVGFGIIVSGNILKRLFSDKQETRDKMEILNNFLAVILFNSVGAIRVEKYSSAYSTAQLIKDHLGIDLSDHSTGKKSNLITILC